MKIVETGSNYIVLELGEKLVLVSYKTAVAYKEAGICFKTDKFHSTTTSKHINKFLKGSTDVQKIRQDRLDALI